MKPRILCLFTLVLATAANAANFAEVATEGASIGTTYLFDGNASIGGNDFDSANGPPESANFDRTWTLAAPGGGGIDLSITGLAFGLPAAANTDGNVITATITYLGADGVAGGTDDVVLGTTKATLVYTTVFDGSLAGRYEWLFDTPITGNIDGFKSSFRVRLESLEADNGGLTFNMRFKTTSGSAASAVKLDIAGTSSSNGLIDNDTDGIHDAFETNTGIFAGPANTGTNPANPDTDGDGLLDGVENNTRTWVGASQTGTSPVKNDSDNDGLLDGVETNTGIFVSAADTGTNPNTRDRDNDRLSDGYELANGFDPLVNADFDGDGFSDALEIVFYNSDPKLNTSSPGVGTSPAPGSFTPILDSGVTALTAEDLPATLGTAIINEAGVGGSVDADYASGVTGFIVHYPNAFPAAGSAVSISGFAWPVVAVANNASGDILLQFFDPGADGVVDGVDKDVLVGTARGTLTVPGVTSVMYWNFTPINFTSAGTGLVVKIQSTAALRIKAQDNLASGQWYNNEGTSVIGNIRSSKFSIGGTATAPASSYAAWQTANSTAGEISEDHDGDGVSNGVEYFIGGNADTTGFDALPGVNGTGGNLSVIWSKAATYSGTYGVDFVVETSDNLAGAWIVEKADPEAGFTVTFPSATEVKYTFPNPPGTKKFVRLKVTGP
jgi:hypothetical protein